MAEISASPIPPGPELSEVPFDFLPLGSLLPALPFLMQVYSGFVSPSLTQKSGLSARGTRRQGGPPTHFSARHATYFRDAPRLYHHEPCRRDRRFNGLWERPVRSLRQDPLEVEPSGSGGMCGVFGHRAPRGATALNSAYHDNAPDLPREIIWAWRSLSACQSPSDPGKCPDSAPDQYASMIPTPRSGDPTIRSVVHIRSLFLYLSTMTISAIPCRPRASFPRMKWAAA
jgi:hypothetical protein